MAYVYDPPFAYFDKQTQDLTGLDGSKFRLLMEDLNFTVTLVESPVYGTYYENEDLATGLVELIRNDEADLTASTLAITVER